jgi:hypothetical protein
MTARASFGHGWRVALGVAGTLLGAAVLYVLEKWAPDTSPAIFFCMLMGIAACVSFVAVRNRGPNVLANHGIVGLLATFAAVLLVASGKGAFGLSLIFSLFGMVCGLFVGLFRKTVHPAERVPGADTSVDGKS